MSEMFGIPERPNLTDIPPAPMRDSPDFENQVSDYMDYVENLAQDLNKYTNWDASTQYKAGDKVIFNGDVQVVDEGVGREPDK